MHKHLKIVVLIIITLIHSIGSSYADEGQYKFRHLTTKNGFPSNSINGILKDYEGLMWFATDNGLARYDGYNIKTFNLPFDSTEITYNNEINCLFEDKAGTLLVGTSKNGLMQFDRIEESFDEFITPYQNTDFFNTLSINDIYQDIHSDYWIGTNNGLVKYNAQDKNYKLFKHEDVDGDNSKNQISAIFEDKSGKLWVGTLDGLFFLDKLNETFTRFDLDKEIPAGRYRKVTCIIEDTDDNLWIGTYHGMFKYNPKNGILKKYVIRSLMDISSESNDSTTYLSNIVVMSIVDIEVNSKNYLWIATQYGLNFFDIEKEKFEVIHENINQDGSISSYVLKELYLDNQGQLWIATFTSGINVFNTKINPFHQVFASNDNAKHINWQPISFCLDNSNTLWIGAFDDGLYQLDSNLKFEDNYTVWDFSLDNINKPHNDRITCIYEDSNNILWLGFYDWGLVIFDKENKSFQPLEFGPESHQQPSIQIDNILQDQFGILWIGTNSGLYYKNKRNNLVSPLQEINHNSLNNSEILCLFEDHKQNLWVSTRDNGLFCLKTENRKSMTFTNYIDNRNSSNGYCGDFVNSIYEDYGGELWFGTNKGLNIYNYTQDKFLPDTIFNKDYEGLIIKVYGDNQKRLWLLHSNHGLVRYTKTSTSNFVKIYNTGDGLPFDNFNTKYFSANSFYQSNDGRLYMGCNVGSRDGFFWFHPDSIHDNKHVPNIVLTSFNVGNSGIKLDSSINIKKDITLNYYENFFSFEFAALNFLMPEKNQYAYYLEGFEENWNYSGNRRFANYTGVPPGEYTFKVKGSNNDGYWNEDGTSIRVSISPPFWKTWWAYFLFSLISISLVYFIIHFYLRRQRLLHNLALEQIETEKLKELDGLKTKFFTNISHEFRTPLTLILGPVQQLLSQSNDQSVKKGLSVVQKNAIRLKGLVHQLLNLSKLESGEMKLQASELDLIDFVRRYHQAFESLAHQKKIVLRFFAERKELNAFIDSDKMAQVLNNLLSNAFKFTPDGGKISVSVEMVSEEKAIISITDSGCGIPSNKLQHIFDRFYQADDSISRDQEGTGIGLAIVKEMVKIHHGKIEVNSEPGIGTTFLISLKLGSSHLNTDEISGSANEQLEFHEADQITPSIITKDTEETTDVPVIQKEKIESKPILLIVEDNADMRTFIRGYFVETYEILEAENGIVGLAKANNYIPDVVISDVMMPKMDGNEFCQKLKTNEKTCHIPVILLTARASKESRLEGLETGADDFVTKPFDGEELQVRVKNIVDQRSKLREYYKKDFIVCKEVIEEQVLSMDENFILKAKTLAKKNLSDSEYSVDKLASDMAMSRVQLHRKLKALINHSTTEFIRTIRLNYAIELLKKRAGTISEIAYDSGFNNPTYFATSFKKQYGISPSEYLNQLDQ